ncbi:secreted protein [Rhodopirellula sallentina SM41]|uniref:Secreted protein n=1 Tax=Rhodopirellula sallentina SM41 TaxID=1263870 RepID=M5U407_9BACT|nr:secreted protein [Rhodopirellula sallentina SM41]
MSLFASLFAVASQSANQFAVASQLAATRHLAVPSAVSSLACSAKRAHATPVAAKSSSQHAAASQPAVASQFAVAKLLADATK